MRRSPCFIAVWFCTLLVMSPAYGWGEGGHRIIAAIAEARLSPDVRQRVLDDLGVDHLSEVATWADRVRRQDGYRHTAPWHYLNPPDNAGTITMEMSPPEGSVLSAIVQQIDVLQRPDASAQARIEALRFLVHFVGDIHMPLHVGRAEDRGGNGILVSYKGEVLNLHWLWDGALIEDRCPYWAIDTFRLYTHIDEQDAAIWSSELEPATWATQSHDLALSVVYPAVADNGVIDDAYRDAALPIIDEQLQKAGIRLAAVLERLYADGR